MPSYRHLQILAKQQGIRANQKKAVLERLLSPTQTARSEHDARLPSGGSIHQNRKDGQREQSSEASRISAPVWVISVLWLVSSSILTLCTSCDQVAQDADGAAPLPLSPPEVSFCEKTLLFPSQADPMLTQKLFFCE
jgi:hypothetical protein